MTRRTAMIFCLSCLMLAGADKPEDGFTLLFPRNDFTGFHGATDGWAFDADGVLAWQKKAGDIWTDRTYDNFILDFEYKVAKESNSGVFIRCANPKDPVQTGLEIQVYDSHGRKPDKHHAGAVYDALAPRINAEKPVGEWNRMTITADGPSIKVVLNGHDVIDMNLDRWITPGQNPDGTKNKYKAALKDFPRKGHIQFQDHHKPVWYRKVRIKDVR